MKRKKVFVGISGGVDSAVSVALLKDQGYEVIGVFIRTWHPDFLVCNEEEERLDAMRIAAHLDIPFLTFDFSDIYKKEVADYMIREYKAGKTPNPDVMCNKEIKFGAFFKKAISMGADYVATGHYAQKYTGEPCVAQGSPVYFGKGVDPSKDQSYFLWTLKQEQLKKILFPIGHLNKIEVRKLAKKFKLPVAEKKDSQGICFLGAVDLKDFLKHYIKEKKGEVVLVPSEVDGKREVIGYHNGVVFYTMGERHGFVITKKSSNDGRYYVIGKDINKNILYVSQNKENIYSKKDVRSTAVRVFRNFSKEKYLGPFLDKYFLSLRDTNWIYGVPKSDKDYTAQIRYHGEFLSCRVKNEGSEQSRRVRIIFEKPVLVASGQSCVFYDKDVCLGGGVVV